MVTYCVFMYLLCLILNIGVLGTFGDTFRDWKWRYKWFVIVPIILIPGTVPAALVVAICLFIILSIGAGLAESILTLVGKPVD